MPFTTPPPPQPIEIPPARPIYQPQHIPHAQTPPSSPTYIIVSDSAKHRGSSSSSSTPVGLWLFLFGWCVPLCWCIGACCAGGNRGAERPFRVLNIVMTVLVSLVLVGVGIFYVVVLATAATTAASMNLFHNGTTAVSGNNGTGPALAARP